MSVYDPDFDFSKALARVTKDMRSYRDVTDHEAHVMAVCLIAPRGWLHILKEEGIPENRARDILRSGADKYRRDGGKEYWQG